MSGVRRVERSLLQQGIIRLQPLDKTETQGIRDVRLSMHCLMLTRLIFLISSTTAPSKIQLEENFLKNKGIQKSFPKSPPTPYPIS